MLGPMNTPFSVSVLTTIDPVLRGVGTVGLALDDPHLVTVTHDILRNGIRRVVADATGIVEDVTSPLEHACLSCAIREDVIPVLERLRARNQWTRALVALPVTAEAAPLLRALEVAFAFGGPLSGAAYGTTVALLDAHTLASDAFDESSVTESGAGLHPDDDRVVAEAVAPIVSTADLVLLVCDEDAPASGLAVAHHLRGDGASVASRPADALDTESTLRSRCRIRDTLERANPLRPTARSPHEEAGVWTLRLESPHPFHPARLRANLHRLADHRVRTRGVFWVASRPDSACIWESAGRQLSVGESDPWNHRPRHTTLVVTGTGRERRTILEAFHETLARPHEMAELAIPGADDLADWFDDDAI